MTTRTPWGPAQTVTRHARGITEVDTAGHGGILLSPTRNADVHPVWRDADGAYEEDTEWSIVVITYPQHFPEARVAYAHDCARRWYAKQYAVAVGVATSETVAVGECPRCGYRVEWYGGWTSKRCGRPACAAEMPLHDEHRTYQPDGTTTTVTPAPGVFADLLAARSARAA